MNQTPVLLALAAMLLLPPSAAAQAAVQSEPAAAVKQAQALLESGDLPGALVLLQRALTTSPGSFEIRLALGRALDLDGQHGAARPHLEEAVKLASDEDRNTALTALGISYAFQSKPDDAARYYQRAFDAQVQADDRRGAAALANALGRIYLESGNLRKAQEWYTTGYETSRKIPAMSPVETALWDMRRHNAFGRIAARRRDRKGALEHAAAAKALLDKGGNENQRAFHPYLLGYIAFFSKEYRQAVAELLQGDQADPFVLGMIAQSHQRLGQRDAAAEYYRKVMAINVHSINSAFARPLARAFLR